MSPLNLHLSPSPHTPIICRPVLLSLTFLSLSCEGGGPHVHCHLALQAWSATWHMVLRSSGARQPS